MKNVRRGLREQRSRLGGQGQSGEGQVAGSSSPPQRDQGAVVQPGQGLHQGRRDCGFRDGRGDEQSGDVRTYSGGHQRKEGKNGKCRSWRAWFCALWAGCQNASAYSTGRQIDNFKVCHAPETHLCFPDYTTIWDHKIIKKDIFVSEWKASIKAIDLAFEMGCSTQDNAWTFVKPPRCNRSRRHIRFNTAVDLHAGPEDDAELTRWHHALEVPYHRASLFHNEWESDQVSFMARHDPGLPPVHERTEEPHLLDQRALAQQEENELINVLVDATSEGAVSEDSWSSDTPVRSSWRTTLIFALHRQATTLRLDWRDYDLVHDSIAHELQLFPADVYHVHRVRHPPDDLFQAYVEPVVVQRALDLAPGSTERMVLVACGR